MDLQVLSLCGSVLSGSPTCKLWPPQPPWTLRTIFVAQGVQQAPPRPPSGPAAEKLFHLRWVVVALTLLASPSQQSLSFTACRSLSCKLSFHGFCPLFGCFMRREEGGPGLVTPSWF